MDVVVTIAKQMWLRWLCEGDLPGEASTGEWALYFGSPGARRKVAPPKHLNVGDRVYICAHGLIRGYAPLVRIADTLDGYALVRAGGAVVTTIGDTDGRPMWVTPFRGVRYRWWDTQDEIDFSDWMDRGLTNEDRALVKRMVELRRDPRAREILRRESFANDVRHMLKSP